MRSNPEVSSLEEANHQYRCRGTRGSGRNRTSRAVPRVPRCPRGAAQSRRSNHDDDRLVAGPRAAGWRNPDALSSVRPPGSSMRNRPLQGGPFHPPHDTRARARWPGPRTTKSGIRSSAVTTMSTPRSSPSTPVAASIGLPDTRTGCSPSLRATSSPSRLPSTTACHSNDRTSCAAVASGTSEPSTARFLLSQDTSTTCRRGSVDRARPVPGTRPEIRTSPRPASRPGAARDSGSGAPPAASRPRRRSGRPSTAPRRRRARRRP